MPDPGSQKKKSIPINIRPPSFERRYIAAETDDSNTLVALASDESYFVRRQALQNHHTPQWIIKLLVRAGATPDLRGKGEFDPNLDRDSLRRLAETGSWARKLVCEHPNTSAEVLAALKDQPSIPLRLAIAGHPNADKDTLAALCTDIDSDIRAQAIANPNCPPEVIELLVIAGATPDLQGVTRIYGESSTEGLIKLADMGAWGRFLVARRPDCPEDLLVSIPQDPDWRVRSGLLDNPNTPDAFIERMLDTPIPGDVGTIQNLSQQSIPREVLGKLALHPNPEVRFALARHPAATSEILGILLTDGIKEIRRLAASHPSIRISDLQRLVRAGSTPDLMGLSEPDLTMSQEDIHYLLDGGVWARQLAVRHPNTGAETLAHLLCDREPKIREWAAVHPNLDPEIKNILIRAGSGTDFQGIIPPDPGLPSEKLWQIRALGPWGEWVVANNPHAPARLLDSLAKSDDPQVRMFVVSNPNTPLTTMEQLEKDPVEEVRQAARKQLQND